MTTEEAGQAGRGCFVKGCLISLLAAFTLLILFLGGTWYLYCKALGRFTSPESAQIAVEPITDSDYRAAEETLNQLRAAAIDGKRETIVFTATDLNALMTRHPDFANPRRKIRISMAGSVMTVDMSLPFDRAGLPYLTGRWLNATASFTFEFIDGEFRINPTSLVANGHPVPQLLYSESFVSSFNRSFTRSFTNAITRNREGATFWRRIKSITIPDDKLVVVTEPEN